MPRLPSCQFNVDLAWSKNREIIEKKPLQKGQELKLNFHNGEARVTDSDGKAKQCVYLYDRLGMTHQEEAEGSKKCRIVHMFGGGGKTSTEFYEAILLDGADAEKQQQEATRVPEVALSQTNVSIT